MENSEQRYDFCLELLRRASGYPDASFRPGQWEAVSRLFKNEERLLVVQRTGWGKSLVYFLLTRLLREDGFGPTLLVSPLLSLMRDQVRSAERLELRAVSINSSNLKEWDAIYEALEADNVDLLLVSPERLGNNDFVENHLIPVADRIGLMVVDEAHCISDWGHDFRPDYRRLVRLLVNLPENIRVLATTATANDRVVEDVMEQIGPRLQVIRGPLTRASLQLQTIRMPNQAARMAWLAETLSSLPGSGIIYTLTTRDAEQLAAWLQSEGIQARAYHGRKVHEERLVFEQSLLDNSLKALVATTALGMGFDKPDLSFVIHFQAPQSIVHYYQQVGRAGRALEDAHGVLLTGREDQDIVQYFIESAFPKEDDMRQVLDALDAAEYPMELWSIEPKVNLRRAYIERILRILASQDNPPVVRDGKAWARTQFPLIIDRERIENITQQRWAEWAQILEYSDCHDCLMQFLALALDDRDCEPCGRCTSCVGQEPLPSTYSNATALRAVEFLNHLDLTLTTQRRWKASAFRTYGWSGNIDNRLRAEEGRTLAKWNDVGWGKMVREGKHSGRFDDELVDAAAELICEQWAPNPGLDWVTCVASIKHPVLVPDFAKRLAKALDLPFVDCVEKIRSTEPQKSMQNSFQQARNLDGAFAVQKNLVQAGPVLLVDDLVDSSWTMTVIGALLREAGSGSVYPFALASTATG